MPYINGDGGGSLNYVFAEKTVPGSSVKSVRDGDYCLIRKGNSEYEYELYDMKSDPFEQDDISDEMETERERLAAIMEEWELDMKGIAAEIGDGSSVELDADRTDKLKGLGYLE
ncbi:MAG: hypothetical protein GY771_05195 [bacterium]|nr:hypothetical protein [bacterium]